MEQKRILITYFDKFWFRKNNYSRFVGEFLTDKLQCDSIMLKVKGIGVKDLTELQKYIEENKPEIIVAMGEIGVCKHNIQLERVKNEDNNNFMRPTLENNIKIKYIEERGIKSMASPCLKVRNYLHRNAKKINMYGSLFTLVKDAKVLKILLILFFAN